MYVGQPDTEIIKNPISFTKSGYVIAANQFRSGEFQTERFDID